VTEHLPDCLRENPGIGDLGLQLTMFSAQLKNDYLMVPGKTLECSASKRVPSLSSSA
jgi:hypothetical protein